MHHAFVDTYADLNTPLHKIGPRIKIILVIIFLLIIIFTPIRQGIPFLLYAAVLFSMIYISKIPLKFIFKKMGEIIPFITIISLSTLFRSGGHILFFSCVIKAVMAMMLLLLLSSTTKFTQLLEALKCLKTPGLFINLLSFMYRYSFLLEDEFLATKRAYLSRNVSSGKDFRAIRALGNIVGTLFIHAYERAERVYLAMCARGYDGE